MYKDCRTVDGRLEVLFAVLMQGLRLMSFLHTIKRGKKSCGNSCILKSEPEDPILDPKSLTTACVPQWKQKLCYMYSEAKCKDSLM